MEGDEKKSDFDELDFRTRLDQEGGTAPILKGVARPQWAKGSGDKERRRILKEGRCKESAAMTKETAARVNTIGQKKSGVKNRIKYHTINSRAESRGAGQLIWEKVCRELVGARTGRVLGGEGTFRELKEIVKSREDTNSGQNSKMRFGMGGG